MQQEASHGHMENNVPWRQLISNSVSALVLSAGLLGREEQHIPDGAVNFAEKKDRN